MTDKKEIKEKDLEKVNGGYMLPAEVKKCVGCNVYYTYMVGGKWLSGVSKLTGRVEWRKDDYSDFDSHDYFAELENGMWIRCCDISLMEGPGYDEY